MADQERFRSLMPIYLRDAGIALAVYDISNNHDDNSFENIESWLLQLQQYGPKDLKCALIGNKVDLDSDRREVPAQEGQLFADDHDLYYEETSAKSGEGIYKVKDIGLYY